MNCKTEDSKNIENIDYDLEFLKYMISNENEKTKLEPYKYDKSIGKGIFIDKKMNKLVFSIKIDEIIKIYKDFTKTKNLKFEMNALSLARKLILNRKFITKYNNGYEMLKFELDELINHTGFNNIEIDMNSEEET